MRRLRSPINEGILNKQDNIKNSLEVNRYTISIVTLLFGGSAIARKVDSQNPIRPSEIRGHLRFWWRATIGAKFTDAYDLKQKERELFGDASLPSKIKVWVENVNSRNRETYVPPVPKNYKQIDNCPYPRYLFQKDSKNNSVDYISDLNFELCFSVARSIDSKDESVRNLKKELEAAIWAWVNFGGIGARTRRGAGSLYCEYFSPDASINNAKTFNDWFIGKLTYFEIQINEVTVQREWPTLSNHILITDAPTSIIENGTPGSYSKNTNIAIQNIRGIWTDVIDCYSKFRHRKSKSNNKKRRNEKGRSLWPEPDVIRAITGMREPDHVKNHPESKQTVIAFARAQFGLPIVFKFNQARHLNNLYSPEREPYTTRLLPKNKDRLSSPLILKAIAIAPENNRAESIRGFGAIIRLNQPPLQQLELQYADIDPKTLKSNPEDKKHVEQVIQKLQAEQIGSEEIYPHLSYENHPMQKNINSKTKSGVPTISALEAFFHSEEVKSFCKIQIPTS